MNWMQEFESTSAFNEYKNKLIEYIDDLKEDNIDYFQILFNEYAEEIRIEKVYSMNEINDLFYGLSFTEAFDSLNLEKFSFDDPFIRWEETYTYWYSLSEDEFLGMIECDSSDMAKEFLNLDISRYTSITDAFVLDCIRKCEEEASIELEDRFSYSSKE